MRKFSILLSVLVLAAMILVACGGASTSTAVPTENIPPTTVVSTETSAATEAPTTTTETPGIPVTGEPNPARLSNELNFTVWDQNGNQIGKVSDMILDFDNTKVAYAIVDTSGFGSAGNRKVLVPWSSLQLQTGTSSSTSGQQNAFILQGDVNTFNNAPDFDLTNLPQMGQPATDWDLDIRNFWQNGGTGTGTGLATSTSTTGSGGTGLATATAGTGTGLATATASTGTGTGTGTGTMALQGVALASQVLGSTVTIVGTGTGAGTGTGLATSTATTGTGGTGLATATAGAGTGLATSTPSTGVGLATSTSTTGSGGTGLATATAGTGTGLATSTPSTGTGTGTGSIVATIEDVIVATDSGKLMYFLLNTDSSNNQLIPVPLSMFTWDSSAQGFVFNADATMLQNAPGFASDQFPDTSVSGWNSEFDAYWQSNGNSSGAGGGSGTGTQATATATP